MLDGFWNLLRSDSLSPHGICLLWRPELIWTHVVSDALIGLAYFSIPLAMGVFLARRRDVTFGWVGWCFAVFILACGTTHFMSIWTLWVPDYGIEALVKVWTAVASVLTAALLWPMLPRLIALPSPAQLRAANAVLEQRIAERDAALDAVRRETVERLKVEEMLRQSQKMEALGQLTGGIAHDFNNLLQVVSGGVQMLERDADTDRKRRILSGMRQAVERGAALTRQLLGFARKQPLRPEPMDLAQRIRAMRDLLERSLRGDIAVEMSFEENLWPVEVDGGELELAILNLAVNARDAMPNGGTLAVRAEKLPAGAPGNELGGDAVRLEVADTGVGIAPGELERVFEPFFTTKEVGKGSGLGLSQVYGFAQQSGGTVRIASAPGRGTTVTILLPRSTRPLTAIEGDEPPTPARTVPAVPPSGTGGLPAGLQEAVEAARPVPEARGRLILLVEDDNSVADLVAGMLDDLGFRVIRAANATAALRMLAGDSGVDVILSDVMMPGGLSGVELAEEVARRYPRLPVVLMTGFSEALRGDAQPRAIAVLRKPFTTGELARALGSAGTRAPAPAN